MKFTCIFFLLVTTILLLIQSYQLSMHKIAMKILRKWDTNKGDSECSNSFTMFRVPESFYEYCSSVLEQDGQEIYQNIAQQTNDQGKRRQDVIWLRLMDCWSVSQIYAVKMEEIEKFNAKYPIEKLSLYLKKKYQQYDIRFQKIKQAPSYGIVCQNCSKISTELLCLQPCNHLLCEDCLVLKSSLCSICNQKYLWHQNIKFQKTKIFQILQRQASQEIRNQISDVFSSLNIFQQASFIKEKIVQQKNQLLNTFEKFIPELGRQIPFYVTQMNKKQRLQFLFKCLKTIKLNSEVKGTKLDQIDMKIQHIFEQIQELISLVQEIDKDHTLKLCFSCGMHLAGKKFVHYEQSRGTYRNMCSDCSSDSLLMLKFEDNEGKLLPVKL